METEIYFLTFIAVLCLLIFFVLSIRVFRETMFNFGKQDEPRFISISGSKVFLSQDVEPYAVEMPDQTHTNGVSHQKQVVRKEDASMETNKSERRNAQRRHLKSIVDFVKDGRLFKEVSRDFSRTGLFITSRQPERHQVDDHITLTFQAPGGEPRKHEGRIVRLNKRGFGVAFSDA